MVFYGHGLVKWKDRVLARFSPDTNTFETADERIIQRLKMMDFSEYDPQVHGTVVTVNPAENQTAPVDVPVEEKQENPPVKEKQTAVAEKAAVEPAKQKRKLGRPKK